MGAWLGLAFLVAAIVALGLALARQSGVVADLQDQVDRIARLLPPPQAVAGDPARPRLFRALYDTAEQPMPAVLRDPAQRLLAIAGVLAVVGLVLFRSSTAPKPDPALVAEVVEVRAAHDSLSTVVAGLRDSLRTAQLAASAPASRAVPPRAATPARARGTRKAPANPSGVALPSLPKVGAPASP